jgi:hypothetical protein
MSHHPYERFLGTAYHPCSGWSQLQETPISIRSLMTANGDGAKKIWATEYGNATPDWTDETGQASRMSQAMVAWKSFPWAGPLFTFNLWDTHGSIFGLLRSDWSPRPAWFAFQAAAA